MTPTAIRISDHAAHQQEPCDVFRYRPGGGAAGLGDALPGLYSSPYPFMSELEMQRGLRAPETTVFVRLRYLPRPVDTPDVRICSGEYGSMARCRARLRAEASQRWCLAQVPVLRRGSMRHGLREIDGSASRPCSRSTRPCPRRTRRPYAVRNACGVDRRPRRRRLRRRGRSAAGHLRGAGGRRRCADALVRGPARYGEAQPVSGAAGRERILLVGLVTSPRYSSGTSSMERHPCRDRPSLARLAPDRGRALCWRSPRCDSACCHPAHPKTGCSRPSTYARRPFWRNWLHCSASFSHVTTENHSVSSRRSPSWPEKLRLHAMLNVVTAFPFAVSASLGISSQVPDDHDLIESSHTTNSFRRADNPCDRLMLRRRAGQAKMPEHLFGDEQSLAPTRLSLPDPMDVREDVVAFCVFPDGVRHSRRRPQTLTSSQTPPWFSIGFFSSRSMASGSSSSSTVRR